jgi:arylsulfate sulfotransferase
MACSGNSKRLGLAAAVGIFTAITATGMSVTVTPSAQSPAAVGTIVTFTAVSDATTTNLWYRFRVRKQGGDFQIVRDFGPVNTLDWTASTHEGAYEVEVSARNLDSGERAEASSVFQFQSVVTGDQAAVSPTKNSLVFLYSAPECARGSRMRVEFTASDGSVQHTPYQACRSGSMNFYLAGLRANTNYTAHHTIDDGSEFRNSADVAFSTGDLPAGLYTDSILIPSQNAATDSILLGGPLNTSPVANDLAGNIIWYGPAGNTFLTRIESGGEFWGIVEAQSAGPDQQVVRKFDLAGMTLLETNAARVNEQLQAMGKRAITGFHHEARPLRDGRIAVLAGVEQIMSDVQGAGPVDILGDMIIVLDKDLNVVWTWDTFDNLDVHRMAVLKETCPTSGCPNFYLAPTANDWTHGNSLQQTADGNLLYSTRNQDWLIKVAYDSANGDGHVMWKIGVDGDFGINSKDPFPWFSHQHDGNFALADPTKLLVFDDGNTRVAALGGGNSRGQVFAIDETNRMATPVLNADLGVYALAVGSAEALRDGNYHFDAGFVPENNIFDSYSFEVDSSGKVMYEAHQNVILYRTFRMTDMYTPN